MLRLASYPKTVPLVSHSRTALTFAAIAFSAATGAAEPKTVAAPAPWSERGYRERASSRRRFGAFVLSASAETPACGAQGMVGVRGEGGREGGKGHVARLAISEGGREGVRTRIT